MLFESIFIIHLTIMYRQSLFTMITLGIYYPWTLSKVGSRILDKTYLIE